MQRAPTHISLSDKWADTITPPWESSRAISGINRPIRCILAGLRAMIGVPWRRQEPTARRALILNALPKDQEVSYVRFDHSI